MTGDISKAIRDRLLADLPIAAVVGTKVYRNSFPIGVTFPCITVKRIDGARTNDTHQTTGRSRARVQVSVFASTDEAADTLNQLVADALNSLHDIPLSSAYVIRCSDAGDSPLISTVAGVLGWRRDFLIIYQ